MGYKISIKAKDDFRSFKKDYTIEFDFADTNVNFLMGKNGCGKSTIIQSIRGNINSNDDKDKRWSARNNCKEIKEHFDVQVEGFNKVYHLDIDGLDDNLSMFNASSATDLIDLGGLGMNRLSQGERTLIMMARMKKMVADTEDTLIIFDELDNHLDFDFRTKFIQWLNTLFPLSKKIIITHDLLMTALSKGNIIYLMSERDMTNLNKCNIVGKEALCYKNEMEKELFFTIHTSCRLTNIFNKSKKEKKDDSKDKN